MNFFEVNFDGLVGNTHNYAGLSLGNIASQKNAKLISNPKAAAKQGLLKAKYLFDLGLKQGIFPPQERPNIYALKNLGFTGSDSQIIEKAAKQIPDIFYACCSASSMWMANAATVSPSANTNDSKIHFTAANLSNKFHRSMEANTTATILQAIFNNEKYFIHHQPLASHPYWSDEGAANHTNLCTNYGKKGIELFVYGKNKYSPLTAKKYQARQTLQASEGIARLHQLASTQCIFLQQHPDVIDKGVFHNDVIAVGNKTVFLYHENAFLNAQQAFSKMQDYFDQNLELIKVPIDKISIDDAVSSYLFNSQLISLPNDEMALILPTNCQHNTKVNEYLTELISANTSIKHLHFIDVNQSMLNGGGPACLRLRVQMNNHELSAINQSVLLNETIFNKLTTWIDTYYRDQLTAKDLTDPNLLLETRYALDDLTKILNLGNIYHFQC